MMRKLHKMTLLILLILLVFSVAACTPAETPEPPAEDPTGDNGDNGDNGEIPEEPGMVTMEVPVYFGNANADAVVAEIRTIQVDEDESENNIVRLVLEELLAGPESEDLFPGIPDGVSILDVEMAGTLAIVNFSEEMELNHGGGTAGELMTLASLANTLTELDFVEEVLPLVEGQPLFLGHVVIGMDEPLTRADDMIGD